MPISVKIRNHGICHGGFVKGTSQKRIDLSRDPLGILDALSVTDIEYRKLCGRQHPLYPLFLTGECVNQLLIANGCLFFTLPGQHFFLASEYLPEITFHIDNPIRTSAVQMFQKLRHHLDGPAFGVFEPTVIFWEGFNVFQFKIASRIVLILFPLVVRENR